MKCLDAGCDGGHVALFLASVVEPEGKVIGTDTDHEILALARADAEAANLGNIEFHEVDGCKSEWDEEHYARFLLSHLNEPEKCLAALVKACRSEGAIVIEDTDFGGRATPGSILFCAEFDREIDFTAQRFSNPKDRRIFTAKSIIDVCAHRRCSENAPAARMVVLRFAGESRESTECT
jgi:ubiquinone/menaquinone biosynthesis C-methylase UbiE